MPLARAAASSDRKDAFDIAWVNLLMAGNADPQARPRALNA
jgi:hypothetical protein